jgi:ABC-type uncharacterized transport system fused permease/ATPase subunit
VAERRPSNWRWPLSWLRHLRWRPKSLLSLFQRAETELGQRVSSQVRKVFLRQGTVELYDRFIAPYFAQAKAKLALAGIGTGHLLVLGLNVGAIFAAAGFINDMMMNGFSSPSWYLLPAAVCMIGARIADSAVITSTQLFVQDWYKWTQNSQRGLPLLLRAVRNRNLQTLILSAGLEGDGDSVSGGEALMQASGKKRPVETQAEQIMADDFMTFANLSVNLLISAVVNQISLVSYAAALYALSPLVLAGISFLAACRTALTHYAGQMTTRRNNEAVAAYARRRAGMMAVAERAEEFIANESKEEARDRYDNELQQWFKANTRLILARNLLNLINGVFDGVTRWIPLFYAQRNFFGLGYYLGAAGTLDQMRGLTELTGNSLNWYGLNADPIAQWRGAAERITTYILAGKYSGKARWPRYDPSAPLALSITDLVLEDTNGGSKISLDLKGGDSLLITESPIGGGKRIFLHQLTGVLPHEVGTITFGGISGKPGERMVLFQHPNIVQHSFREAMCSLRGRPVEEALQSFPAQEIRQALIDAGFAASLGESADGLLQDPGDDSLGRIQIAKNGLSLPQVQMLQIARALLHKPPVLILDNATSALSEEGVKKAYTLLQKRRPGGITISFSDVHHEQKLPFHNKMGRFDPDRSFSLTVIEHKPAVAALSVLPPAPRGTAEKVFDWLKANW